jgi:peptidyl-prolyl cis-trans isomerase-like protein 2
MFESIQNPVKGKGKEKDVGKRRAYVRVVTSLGGGLNLELFCEKVCGLSVSLCPLLKYDYISGTKNVLQLLDACPSGKV